jgi:leucyl/phenylalanyl-tRNA---protein transferase
MMRIPMLRPGSAAAFPAVELALQEPDGLLCAGADLSVGRLLQAYRHGIFPWYSAGEPILWWSPDPRCVFDLQHFWPSRSLRRFARQSRWRLRADEDFAAVIEACAAPRAGSPGTWISNEMQLAYCELHRAGHAHCFALYDEDELVGGLYGVAMGQVFFGESMFSRRSNASKIVLHLLARQLADWGFVLIDGQVRNPHLIQLGAVNIRRRDFVAQLERHCPRPGKPGNWADDWQWRNAAQLGTLQTGGRVIRGG